MKAETHVVINRENQVRFENIIRAIDNDLQVLTADSNMEYDVLVLEGEQTLFEVFQYGFDSACLLRERGEGKIYGFVHPIDDKTTVLIYAKDDDDLWRKIESAVKRSLS